jgi:hypothetical protein
MNIVYVVYKLYMSYSYLNFEDYSCGHDKMYFVIVVLVLRDGSREYPEKYPCLHYRAILYNYSPVRNKQKLLCWSSWLDVTVLKVIP